MLRWLKQRRERADRERLARAAAILLDRYRGVIARNQNLYIDEALLPADKASIKLALQIGWTLAKNDQEREWSETGWLWLSRFQRGAAKIPNDGKIPAGASPEEAFRIADAVLQIAEAARNEAAADRIEWSRFMHEKSK
jgi:hypothetical protein